MRDVSALAELLAEYVSQILVASSINRSGVRAGYRRADEPTAAELVEDSDDQLFHRVQYDRCHILHPLLPDRRTDSHALRTRRHALSLSCRVNALTDSNLLQDNCLKTLTDIHF